MKRIHITEGQLNELARRINEGGVTNVDITQQFKNDGNQFGPTCQKAKTDAEANGLSPDETSYIINGSIMENCQVYTKAHLKEARRNKLMSESYIQLSKKDLNR